MTQTETTKWLCHGFEYWAREKKLYIAFERIAAPDGFDVRTNDMAYFEATRVKKMANVIVRAGNTYEIPTNNPFKEGDGKRQLTLGGMKFLGQWIDKPAAEALYLRSEAAELEFKSAKTAEKVPDLSSLIHPKLLAAYREHGKTVTGAIAFEMLLIQHLRKRV